MYSYSFFICVSSLLTFYVLAFVWSPLLSKDAIFMLFQFFLTASDSDGTLQLALGLVSMHSVVVL